MMEADLKFISLSSGSSGNCYYISSGSRAILIDVGVGSRAIKKKLLEYDLTLDSIEAILVTHDHFDHIRNVGTFAQRHCKPVYTTRRIHKAMDHHYCTQGRLKGLVKYLDEEVENDIDGIKVTPFEVPHDATQTVGYHIVFEGHNITVVTDVGAVTDRVVEFARKADHLIIESNYDLDMLLTGNYTKELKERIMNGHGHISNEQNSHLLRLAAHEGLQDIYLCHLSGNNNTPERAYAQAKKTLEAIGSRASLSCLPRSAASELFIWHKPHCGSRG